jgi:hypothetical protein
MSVCLASQPRTGTLARQPTEDVSLVQSICGDDCGIDVSGVLRTGRLAWRHGSVTEQLDGGAIWREVGNALVTRKLDWL